MSEEALQVAEERREAKSKGEREIYTQLNAELQGIARRHKKAFLREQCKEKEENRKGKTRDLFKKIGNIKRPFHPKMDTMKDRNGEDLIEVEVMKKRWKEYTEELYKKDLNDPDNHNGTVSHVEPDILECEAKCALGSTAVNKARGGDGSPEELFRILRDDSISCTQYVSKFGIPSWPQDWKRSTLISIPNRAVLKNVQTGQLYSLPMLVRLHSKSSKLGLSIM